MGVAGEMGRKKCFGVSVGGASVRKSPVRAGKRQTQEISLRFSFSASVALQAAFNKQPPCTMKTTHILAPGIVHAQHTVDATGQAEGLNSRHSGGVLHLCPSAEQLPVEGAVLNRLKNIVRADVGCSRQVGEGPGDFENPVVRAGTEVHFLHRMFEIAVSFGAELAVLPDLPRAHG